MSSSHEDAVVHPREKWGPWLVGLIVFLVALSNVNAYLIGVFFDDAIYLLVAKALAEGQGLVYPHIPGTPPAIHYPPMFSALLSLVWRVAPPFPESVIIYKLINPVLLSLAAVAAVHVARRVLLLPLVLAAVVVLLGFVTVPTLLYTSTLLSEPLFLAVFFPSILVAERLVSQEGPAGGSAPLFLRTTRWAAVPVWAVLMGLCLAAVILTRTVGGVLLPAVLLVLAWDRRWRDAAVVAAVTILCILPWQYFVWKHSPDFPDVLRGSYGPYLEWVVEGYREGGLPLVWDVLAKNLRDAWGFLGIFFSPLVRWIRPLVVLGLIACVGAGIVFGIRAPRARVIALTLLAYLVVVIGWPYQIERFLWGVWPALLLLGASGVYGSVRLLRARGAPRIGAAIAVAGVLLAAGHATYNARGLSRGWASSASASMSERMLPGVQAVRGDDRLRGGVIASDFAPGLALYTGEQVVLTDILRVRDHIEARSPEDRAEMLGALDAYYRPSVYVLLANGPAMPAFQIFAREPSRVIRELSRPGARVRVFIPEFR